MMMQMFRRPPAAHAGDGSLRPKGDSYVRIDGRDYALQSWNTTGFHIAPFDGALIPGQRANVAMVVRDWHDRQGMLKVEGMILVTGIEDGGMTARWVGLPRYKADAIADYHRRKLDA